jgi:choline dehydrogenase-like flavoprotein
VRADVCIVGSGAGGAPVARALAEAGASVAVLEEGRAYARTELTARPRDMLATLYRDAGQTATVGTPPIMLPVGKAVGGTTLVNSGTVFRAPAHVRERWHRQLGLDLALDAHYAQVERELRVTRVTEHLAGRNALIARRGAEALGWSGRFLDRNAHGCVGSGVCAFGCPTGAKQHTGQTYMRWATAAGARTITGAGATKVIVRAGRVRGVEAVTPQGRITVEADRVVVAAGTLHTPGLLAARGLTAPALGRNLTIHPATGVWALMDEEVDMARGVPQSYCVDEFAAEGIMLEGIAGPPDYLAMAVPFSGERHREVMLQYRRVAQFGLMVSDTSRGRVLVSRLARRAGRPIVRYDLNRHDTETVHRGIVRIAQLLFAAGARTVFTPLGAAPEVQDAAALERVRPRARDLKLMAFHPLGTARASARPRDGVVDADLESHTVKGLHVCDGSVVPTALGVNPQLTIMALATRLGGHLCRS